MEKNKDEEDNSKNCRRWRVNYEEWIVENLDNSCNNLSSTSNNNQWLAPKFFI